MEALPKEFPLPVAVVQHRTPESGGRLCELLQQRCPLRVATAEDKEAVGPGRVYVAPADYHMLLERGTIALSTDEPVCYARPSIDVLFESAADAYGTGVIGVVMTGASHDGAHGLARINKRGGLTVVEDPATAESREMPDAALSATKADHVLTIDKIAPLLASLGATGKATAS